MSTGPDQPVGERRPRRATVPLPPTPGQLASTSWRLARQLPGVSVVTEAVGSGAQRIGQAAAQEVRRVLGVGVAPQRAVGARNPEEQRVRMLLQNTGSDPEPLRTAMGELLQRSSAADSRGGREYLFGTIISQLVPDEARILAALAGGRRFAVVDVVAKQVGRSPTRVVLANASTVGSAARVTLPADVPTYLTRLHSFGLIEFDRAVAGLDAQFAELYDNAAVSAARKEADARFSSAKFVRKSVTLSQLGREFWTAAAPSS